MKLSKRTKIKIHKIKNHFASNIKTLSRLGVAVVLTMLWPAYSTVAADDTAFNSAQVTYLMDDGFHQEALEALRRAPRRGRFIRSYRGIF